MSKQGFQYPRPRQLSDPHSEWGPVRVAKLLATSDAELQWHQYKRLLGPYFPAGTYEEVIYFLPLAFDSLVANKDHSLDLITTPIWFASEYDAQLRHDRLRDAVRDRIYDCFSHWTREFKVIHFDRVACQAKGWGIQYCDIVECSEIICQGMEDLVRFKTHAGLALEFFQSLTALDGDAIKAAWLLEFANAQTAVYQPPDDPQVRALLNDQTVLAHAAGVVRGNLVPNELSPTYWNDVFAALNL